ncbi:MAG: hypothetical protein WD793_05295 [Steroidobacteraceae bacterium]
MTRDPAILLALARQGYSNRTIAEIAGVTPAAIQALLGSGQRLVAGVARAPVTSRQRKF